MSCDVVTKRKKYQWRCVMWRSDEEKDVSVAVFCFLYMGRNVLLLICDMLKCTTNTVDTITRDCQGPLVER